MTSQFAVRGPSRRTASRDLSKPLKRGQACVNCRSLKIKCDGAKPSCGPCTKNPRTGTCEYTEDIVNSRTRELEETVAHLRSRILELENPTLSVDTATLASSHPSSDLSGNPSKVEGWRVDILPPSPFPSESKPLHPGSPPSSSLSAYSAAEIENLPSALTESLFTTFLPVAFELGFFLDTQRFRASCALPATGVVDHQKPTTALLGAVYLMGAHLTAHTSISKHEPAFLRHTLQQTSVALEDSHPHRIIQTLQAEVLLAYYFFRNSRYIEAKCHTSIAVSITLACGLHRLRPMAASSSPVSLVADGDPFLPPPVDDLELGERINAFWTVFILHKSIAVAMDPPSSICGAFEAPGIRIDTPWPLDLADYSHCSTANLYGNSTVRNFLNDLPSHAESTSSLALLSKAAIIYHRAAHLAGQWTSAFGSRESQAYMTAFSSLDALNQKYRSALESLGNSRDPTCILAHALSQAATIKMHRPFAVNDYQSNTRCMDAARSVIDITTQVADRSCINPIYGTLWMDACLILAGELSRVRSLQWNAPAEPGTNNSKDLSLWLESGLSTMSAHAQTSPLIYLQLNRVHEALM